MGRMPRPAFLCTAALSFSVLLWLQQASAAMEIIGHRGGMSGHMSFVPEESRAAYAEGASFGARYIEPDLVSR